jgi:beta-glucanase (GH16 family)
MGMHPFGDPRIVDEFEKIHASVDVRQFHVYTAEWTPDHVAFLLDGQRVKLVQQSPDYPMQLMLGIYEFEPDETAEAYPKEFVIDYIRGFRRPSND